MRCSGRALSAGAGECDVLRSGGDPAPGTGPDGGQQPGREPRSLRPPRRLCDRFPRQATIPRLRIRNPFQGGHGRSAPGCLRPRRHRRGAPRPRAPVLVFLLLQRLQQSARGRLGDDPVALRRRHRRGGVAARAGGGRLRPAQRRARRRTGMRRSWRRRDPAAGLRLARVTRLLLWPRPLARLGAGRLRAGLRHHQWRAGAHRPRGAPHPRCRRRTRTTRFPG